jgi:DNA (cytosine-5)-methyltransferase 1
MHILNSHREGGGLLRRAVHWDVRAPTFLDLFSGAGGLSLGLSRAGWTPSLAVDSWPDAVATYRRNFSGHDVADLDIRELTAARLAELLGEEPDWVVGGPPCQGFSTVGKRLRHDPRNLLVREFHRVVKTLRPAGFVIENVLGLKDMRFQDGVIELFDDLGYDVSFHVLRAADYGIPQLRRRVVFVGHRDQGFFGRPEASLRANEYVTVWDAIGDLPAVEPGETAHTYEKSPFADYQRVMRADSTELQGHKASNHPPHLIRAISFIPDGGNRRAIPDEFQPSSGFHNSYSRLSSRHPAVAVTSNMGKPSATRCIHPFQHRGLTAREGARLQSFPDTFWFEAGVTSQRLQIANAIPPLLAEMLGRRLSDPASWSASSLEGQRQLALEAEALQLEAA